MLSTTLVAAASIGPNAAIAQQAEREDSDRERALVLFEAAELRYQEARFEDTVELLVEARGLYDDAVISYNLGRAYEELARWSEAAEAFRHYLERAPNARDRPLVEARIERLDASAASGDGGVGARDPDDDEGSLVDAGAPEEPDEETPDDEPDAGGEPATSHRGPSAGAIVVAGVGLLAVGAGVALGALSGSARRDAVDDPVHASSRASFRDAESFATGANVLFVVGGVVAAAGLVWLILDLSLGGETDGEGDGVALGIGPGSIAIRGALP